MMFYFGEMDVFIGLVFFLEGVFCRILLIYVFFEGYKVLYREGVGEMCVEMICNEGLFVYFMRFV